MPGQRIPGEGQGASGRFVAGEEHGDGLVAQERVGHGLARLFVACEHELAEQVVWPVLHRHRAALRDHALDVGMNALAGAMISPVPADLHPHRQFERAVLICRDELDHGLDVILQFQQRLVGLGGEQAAQDDRGGDEHHLVEHFHRLATVGFGLPARDELLCIADHDGHELLHSARREEGRHQLALTAPGIAGGRQHAIPQQQLAHDVVALALVVAIALADVDVIHMIGVNGQDHVARPNPNAKQIAVALPFVMQKLQEALALDLSRCIENERAVAPGQRRNACGRRSEGGHGETECRLR